MNIYSHSVEQIGQGSKFYINFKTRSLKINGRYIIKSGKPVDDSEFGGPLPYESIIPELEQLYNIYNHSIPAEHEPYKTYFKALSYDELSDEDKMYGVERSFARFDLEYYVLIGIITGHITWEKLTKPSNWLFKSKKYNNLVLLKNWITINQ